MKKDDKTTVNQEAASADNNAENPKEQPVNIERYRDPEGLTVKKLDFGLWFIEHKHQLLKLLMAILIIVSALSWLYFFYGYGHYLIYGMKEDERLANDLVNTKIIGHEYFVDLAAKDMIVYTPQILNTGTGRYDLIVQIQNPNKKHWGDFSYSFYSGGEEIASGQSFILPKDTKYVTSLANEPANGAVNARFSVTKINWHRIDPHKIRDWEKYANDRLGIEIEEVEFTPARDTLTADRLRLNDLEFTVSNNTAYSYWEVDFIFLLYRRGVIAGVNRYKMNKLLSQTTRNVTMSWPGNFGRIENVTAIPEVNIMDQENYIDPEGGAGEKK